jgi:organic radical activating enzyme
MNNFQVNEENTLCAAKWLQVTLDLHHGLSKSCHHTAWNTIDINDVRVDPTYLFNTKKVLEERQEMLNGDRPKSCYFCWDIEDKVKKITSDRFKKSKSPWSLNHLQRLSAASNNQKIIPSYLEVLFDNTCNLSCLYCSADSSSLIEQQMSKRIHLSPTVKQHREKRYKKSPYNEEFTNSFFNYLPQLLETLHTLRITGGEPLLSKGSDTLIDFLINNKYPKLTFAINTNLSLPRSHIESFSTKLSLIKENVIKTQLFISIDTIGNDASFIRKGLSFDLFEKNIQSIIKQHQDVDIIIMATLTSLSIPSLRSFLEYIISLKENHPSLTLDITPLKEPSFLSICIMKKHELETLSDCYTYMNSSLSVFSQQEIKQLKMCLDLANSYQSTEREIDRRDLLIKELSTIS